LRLGDLDEAARGAATRGCVGVPAGWAGWRSRGLFAFAAFGAVAFGFVAFAFVGAVAYVLPFFLAGASAAAGASARASAATAGREARRSLRRCGRVRGSEPRTLDGVSSLIERHMIAHRPGSRDFRQDARKCDLPAYAQDVWTQGRRLPARPVFRDAPGPLKRGGPFCV
jgi:hypothetical protein